MGTDCGNQRPAAVTDQQGLGSALRRPVDVAGRFWRRAVRLTEQIRVRDAIVYSNLAVLTQRYGPPPGLAGFELKVFSQNGEDGVLAEIYNRIGTDSRVFVEFGVGPGREGNCVLLADVYGWSGLFMEGSAQHFEALEYKYAGVDRVMTRHEIVTAQNIESLLRDANIPSSFDLLSIDIDSNDYWVWQAISAYRPRVVVCEFNGAIDPTRSLTQPYTPGSGWDRTEYFGASLAALRELGLQKDYTLVHTDLTGTNAFFVRTDEAGAFEDCLPVPARRAVAGFTDFRHRPDPKRRTYMRPDPALPPTPSD